MAAACEACRRREALGAGGGSELRELSVATLHCIVANWQPAGVQADGVRACLLGAPCSGHPQKVRSVREGPQHAGITAGEADGEPCRLAFFSNQKTWNR